MLGRRSLLWTWFPVALWMGVIFFLSTDELSDQRTSRFIGPILRWLNPGISDAAVRTVQYAVRKCGHLSEYAVLAILLHRVLNPTSINPTSAWRWSPVGWALLLTALYACTDEFHQAFVPSRQASVLDVLIDTVGGGIGLLVCWVIGRWRKRS
jgi:VanZ family protein